MASTDDAVNAPSERLEQRYAELADQHRAVLARRRATVLGSEDYIAAQREAATLEVEMNLISGILAERAGRGHVAVPGRE